MKKLLVLFLMCVSNFASANTFSVIIPFSAGGPTDQLWRHIEPSFNERLEKHGIKLITENLPGAGGAIAANKISETSDRLILGFFSPALAIAPVINPDSVRYNATTIKLVGYAGAVETIVVSHLSISEFEKKCKNNTVFFGGSNVGSTSHLLGTVVAKEMKCRDPVHVSYKGISAAYPDLLSGRIDYLVDFDSTASSQIASGRINKLFSMNDRFPNNLENWHVLISNNSSNPAIEIIQREFQNLKNDKAFVENLEKTLKIKNFSVIKNQQWLIKDFETYKKFIEGIKQ
jgi:tripartite-type tricarboxylate transporter receptor subunit TctC